MFEFRSDLEIIQLVIGIIVIVSVHYLIFKIISNRIRISKLSKEELKFDEIRLIYKKLKKHETPEKKLVFKYANDTEKRILVFEVLKKYDKTILFPSNLLTREKASESYLANWLNMNEKYDNLPDEIEYCETNELENKTSIITYKFKSYKPHLLASKGWVYGYVGYATSDNEPYINPKFIVSDFDNIILTKKDLETHPIFE